MAKGLPRSIPGIYDVTDRVGIGPALSGGPIPVSSRTYVWDAQSDGVITERTYRWSHLSPLGHRISGLQLVYCNWYMSTTTEVDNDNAIVVKAAVDIAGTVYPVFFNGQRTVTIQPGAQVVSDPLGIDIAANTTYFTRTFVQVQAAEKWPLSAASGTQSGLGEGNIATDETNVGDDTVTATSAGGYGPSAIIGRVNDRLPGLALIGDSITRGTNTVAVAGHNGYPAIWAANKIAGYLNISRGSWRANYDGNVTPPLRRLKRFSLMAACGITDLVYQSGINDVINSRSDAQIQADILAFANAATALGIRCHIATITPSSTSSDSWATVENQTPHANAQVGRDNNDWRRTVPAPFVSCLDVADLVESERNSWLWKVGYTGDGLHPLVAGASAIAAALPHPAKFFKVP